MKHFSSECKRILYLENGQGYGGAVICLELLLQALDRNRYEPLVSTSYMDSNYQNLRNIVPLIYLPHRFFNKNKLMDRLITKRNTARLFSIADYTINTLPYTRLWPFLLNDSSFKIRLVKQ